MVNHSTLGGQRLFKCLKFYGVTKCRLHILGLLLHYFKLELISLNPAMKASFPAWVTSEASADGNAKVTNLQMS